MLFEQIDVLSYEDLDVKDVFVYDVETLLVVFLDCELTGNLDCSSKFGLVVSLDCEKLPVDLLDQPTIVYSELYFWRERNILR